MTRPFTKHGYDSIQRELDRLWTVERPFVLQEIYEAALQGDRSENAAYIYGKQRLRMIDKRLQTLRHKVKDVTIVDTHTLPPSSTVDFGCFVTLEDEDGKQATYHLVDREEIQPSRNWISTESPMGKALLGKEEGDDFELRLPKGTKSFAIITVYYGYMPDLDIDLQADIEDASDSTQTTEDNN